MEQQPSLDEIAPWDLTRTVRRLPTRPGRAATPVVEIDDVVASWSLHDLVIRLPDRPTRPPLSEASGR